jgi:2-keto-4-pentenoate hydratase/2-oxohepta-3-ene-1,7-dioic acid hydratase in catechol pathway
MGKKARNVRIENAYEYVFGYTAAQDISARDWQTPKRNNGQWLVGMSRAATPVFSELRR